METIFQLIDDGDAEGVRALLAGDPGAAAARDAQGLSALMRAFYAGGGEVADAILAARPALDPWDRLLAGEAGGLPPADARSPDGFTPLHIAVFARNEGAVRALLAAGADPNALSTAPFAQVTPLGTAATFGATELAEILLDHGADTERTADHGNTPLHSAVAGGSRALVELLLARGANPYAELPDGRSARDLARNDEIRALVSEQL